MFKPLCRAIFPLSLIAGVAWAQDTPPATAPNAPSRQAVSPPEKSARLSAGQIELGDHFIVPGARIGPFALGATRAEVEKIIGPPLETQKMDGDLAYSIWRWAAQPNTEPRVDFLRLIFQQERVVQIETNAPEFALPNGLSVRSSEAEWTQFWNEKPERYTVMRSMAGTLLHVTWKKRGFALYVSSPSSFLGSPPPPSQTQMVIVLPKNKLAQTTFGLWSFRSIGPANPQASGNGAK